MSITHSTNIVVIKSFLTFLFSYKNILKQLFGYNLISDNSLLAI